MDCKERTWNELRLRDYNAEKTAGVYNIPTLKGSDVIPERLLGYNYIRSAKDYEAGIHFFLDDYQFERIWKRPLESIEILKNFKCVCTPGFSIYVDMPKAMQIWNIYRSRLIGQIMERWGINVIPTVGWGAEDTFDFCFEGIPQNSVIAVSSVGCVRNKEAKELWIKGMDEAIKRIKPSHILYYGGLIDYDFKYIPVKIFESRKFTKAV